jgi:TRAP-type C4-dicarboxylate transport system substrate-binding protein
MRTLALAMAALMVSAQFASAQEKLIVVTASPAGGDNSIHYNDWGKKVTAESGGAIEIDVRDGITLANFGNVLDRVGNDVIQIGWMLHGVIGGKYPMTETASLPFVIEDAEVGSVALWRLYKTGAFDAEYKDIRPLFYGITGINNVHFSKPLRAADDFHGLKIRVVGKPQSQAIEIFGGTPLAMPPQDMYDGLHRGTIDGVLTPWSAFSPFKLNEVTAYHVEIPLGGTTSMVFMTKKRFDALPAAGRKALEDNGLEPRSRIFGAYLKNQGVGPRNVALSQPDKHKLVQFAPDKLAAWKAKVTTPVYAEWEKQNPGAQKLLDRFRGIYAEVAAGR